MVQFETERAVELLGFRAFARLVLGVSDLEDSSPAKRETQRVETASESKRPVNSVHALPAPDPKSDRIAIFEGLISHLSPGRMLDLGAGHGKFSIAARDLGWQVTAVDARTTRMPMTPGIEWIESDVRHFDPSGYDCISILGLLYHPVEDQLDLLRKCSGTLTIVDTHVGDCAEVAEQGYEGTIFGEVPGATAEARNATPTASWGNEVSFWPTQESLLRMARDTGFSRTAVVLPPHTRNRTFYIFYP